MRLDVNCDLGEGEPLVRTRALMRWISSANVACGGHAGTAQSMRACVRLVKQFGVKLGAHPGPWSQEDMGRGRMPISPGELTTLLLHQVSALEKIAAAERTRLHHIKLHGALYHAIENDARLARAYLACVETYWPSAMVYVLAGGLVAREAARRKFRYAAEGFADRAYRSDGRLVPRDEPGAVISDVSVVVGRVRDLMTGRGVKAVDGRRVELRIDTLCVHADSPNALRMARAVARLL